VKTLLRLASLLLLVPIAAHAADHIFDPARDASADLVAAEHQAAAEHKLILLDVGGNWCGWCVLFDHVSHSDQKLSDVLEKKYVVLHINMSKENENIAFLANYPKVAGYPHFFVLSAGGKLIISQDTSIFERTHKEADGYDPDMLTDFFKHTSKKS
jgi:thiol:disulfide interchange protein